MLAADVIVMATPVYFYAMSAQMKTLIDRCCGPYTEMKNKEFYFIATAAEDDKRHHGSHCDQLYGIPRLSGEPDRERNAILRWCVARGRDRREPDLEASIRAGKTSIILLIATNTFRPGIIHTGDLLLWGANTVVLFYETFSSSYSYTV